MNLSTNLGLVKPELEEKYDITVHNGNMDIIDAACKKLNDGKASIQYVDESLNTVVKEESDPTVPIHVKNITTKDISYWNSKSDFRGDYTELDNKPRINSVELNGNKNLEDLGIQNVWNGTKEEFLIDLEAGKIKNGTVVNITDDYDPAMILDYVDLNNKPTINNIELIGNKSLDDLGIQPKGNYLTTETDPTVPSWAKQPSKPNYSKAEVGLSNVTNDAQVKRSEMGVKNGVATLDGEGKIKSSQLPSYVDDVIEVDSYSNLPTTGESGKIYVTKDTNKTYRWSGSQYVVISETLALGTTSETAYRGDYGNSAYQHSIKKSGNPHNVTKTDLGISNVENKSSATIRGELTKENVTKALGYTPPTTNTTYGVATNSKLGLVKSGTDITVDSSGNVSVNNNSHTHTKDTITDFPTSMPASDVYDWAKQATKPKYTKAEVDLGNVPNVSTNNQSPTFAIASSRTNIASGEKLNSIFGKIMRWFADLKTVAFSGSYNDLSNKPTIPSKTGDLTNNSNFVSDANYVHTDNNYTLSEKTKLKNSVNTYVKGQAESDYRSGNVIITLENMGIWKGTRAQCDQAIKNGIIKEGFIVNITDE